VKLIDFGIAKASGRGLQTIGGTLKGKFGYMAPEYIDGRIDARADLFAVGVIAHELLTNRPLFSGRDDIETLTRVRDMHIDPPSKKNPLVPPEIDDIVMTALARDPERRWQHATALRTALTTLTRRLDLVATNAQVVAWLDGVFAHATPPHDRAETDTETDGQPIHAGAGNTNDSAEQRTVDFEPVTRKLRLAMRGDVPPPPLKTPLGTPAYVPAQRASLPGTTRPGLAVAPSSAVQSFRPVPDPMLPVAPVRSAMVQRDFAQRVSAVSSEPAAPGWRGHALAVVLLVLAAAVAAITVYFLLPLLT
jgi:serine/threonine protein kinase